MRNREIMSGCLVSCRPVDTLSTAAQLMWEHDCGAIPVTADDGQLVGMITDRDICMATYTRGRAPHLISVADTMVKQVYAVSADEPLEAAEQLMRDKQIRRLPVLDGGNRPIGILSLNDLVRHAASARANDGEEREVVHTMAAISRPRSTAIEKAWPSQLRTRPHVQH